MDIEVPYQILEFEEATEKKIKKAFLDGLGVMVLGDKMPNVSEIVGDFYPVFDDDDKTIISYFGTSKKIAKTHS
jgi:hypothetical protein